MLDEFSVRITASQALSPRSKTISHILSHHSLSDRASKSSANLRDQIYNSAAAEKNARAADFSTIKRALGKDAIVISDSLNYIKGYRYQLWCEAKAAGTRCCVLHVAAKEDECKKWNRERSRQYGDVTEDEERVEGKEQDARILAGFGDLVPESHTALYGDKEDFEPRSRSSSTDVQLENGQPAPSLTSFSLRDANPEPPPSLKSLSLNANDQIEFNPALDKDNQDSADTCADQTTTNIQPSHPPPHFPPSLPYDARTLQSLILRYEPPSPFSRWDTPLFTLPSADQHPPYDAIWCALFPTAAPSRKLKARNGNLNTTARTTDTRTDADEVRPHAATVLPPSTSAQALQLLERTTAEIVTCLFTAYKDHNVGDEGADLSVTLPAASTEQKDGLGSSNVEVAISIPPGMTLTQPMLQRLRRKFTQMQRGGIAHGRGHAVEGGRKGVVEAFGRFLEGEFES